MALINLVVNAIHAMEGGGDPAGRAPRPRDGHVEIAVADTGPGIPEEIQPTIFEPFVTTKPEGKGTGLGLSTVLMVVERHKGRIDFTSAPGAGTTFRITIPMFRRSGGAPLLADAPPCALRATPHAARRRVNPLLAACGCCVSSPDEFVDAWPHSAAHRCAWNRGLSRRGSWHAVCLDSVRRKSVLTSKGMLLVGGWVAVAFALVATSGLASAAASQILLAAGAVIALTLSRGSRRD